MKKGTTPKKSSVNRSKKDRSEYYKTNSNEEQPKKGSGLDKNTKKKTSKTTETPVKSNTPAEPKKGEKKREGKRERERSSEKRRGKTEGGKEGEKEKKTPSREEKKITSLGRSANKKEPQSISKDPEDQNQKKPVKMDDGYEDFGPGA
ncbi:unnamed protein product [Caenorhabditis angaria]|uniref:Uncharacterized protein n=1 Tax=Caenorhabditis angaria TaxID=860376 RepID=A0A9P1IRF1_9PELO|nr:unnamed protein product [Caenorhabditis angaria]